MPLLAVVRFGAAAGLAFFFAIRLAFVAGWVTPGIGAGGAGFALTGGSAGAVVIAIFVLNARFGLAAGRGATLGSVGDSTGSATTGVAGGAIVVLAAVGAADDGAAGAAFFFVVVFGLAISSD